MRVINLDFYNNEVNFYLDNKIDKMSTIINFIMDKNFQANNAKFHYDLLFISNTTKTKQTIRVESQSSNNIVSYTIPNDIKNILPMKGQMQLRVIVNNSEISPKVFYSNKYNYIIGDNLDFSIV